MSDVPLETMESVLKGTSLGPSSRTHDLLLYECGRAAALAESKAGKPSSRWWTAALVAAVIGGVGVGRWTANNRTGAIAPTIAGNGATVRSDNDPASELPNSAPEGGHPRWMVKSEVSSVPPRMRAGMTWGKMEASLDMELPSIGNGFHETHIDSPGVWSTGPFRNPLDIIEI